MWRGPEAQDLLPSMETPRQVIPKRIPQNIELDSTPPPPRLAFSLLSPTQTSLKVILTRECARGAPWTSCLGHCRTSIWERMVRRPVTRCPGVWKAASGCQGRAVATAEHSDVCSVRAMLVSPTCWKLSGKEEGGCNLLGKTAPPADSGCRPGGSG